jgi:hypothetical protein
MSGQLTNFPAEINRLHSEIVASVRTTLEKAIRIGELLSVAKEQTAHSHWTEWVQANLEFSERTASRYMRVYQNRDRLKSDSVSDLTSAYALLAAARKPPEQSFLERTRQLNSILVQLIDHNRFTLKLLKVDPALLGAREPQSAKFYKQTVSICRELYERSATEFDQMPLLEVLEIREALDSIIELWRLNQQLAGLILELLERALCPSDCSRLRRQSKPS